MQKAKSPVRGFPPLRGLFKRAFQVTLIPNHNQEVLINKSIGCARFVYNYFLALKQGLKKGNYVKRTKNYLAL
jgi:putative transposase